MTPLRLDKDASVSSGRKRRRKKGRIFPPPERSGRLYVQINPSRVHLFRFLLEAEDNLGIMSVVDRRRAVLMVRFSPHQERAVREFLDGMRQSLAFTMPAVPTPFVADT